ncbi:MAG: autotransporter-associated beta strand repeat protein [Verrucomicrobiales bacterium]|nr:autotransporter-associated beta strand repeat protein [Verrucomicrobiales bacterium]
METKKRKTYSKLVAAIVLAAGILASSPFKASAIIWTGSSANSQFWSDANNWDTLLAPISTSNVILTNGGSTNVSGAINGVVSADMTVANITYFSKVSGISLTTNYHTTLINPAVTLNINRGTSSGALLYVGDITDPLNHDNQYYYTIKGLGASLTLGNTGSPNTNQGVQVTATQRNFTNHVGSLDLSGLDSFSFAGGYFWVGINGAEGTVATDRPAGRVFLAKTNLIVLAGTAYDTLNLGSFRVGESRANTPSQSSLLELGQENNFYTPWLKIGGARTGNGAAAQMYFRSGLIRPTLKLRGTDGISRLGNVRIGDNSFSTSANSIASKGVVDLTGGVVDAFIDTMYVGQGPGGNDNVAAGATAGATGLLTWTEGTFDVSTLLLGYQFGNNLSTNTGTLNVRGANAKLIAGRLVVGRDAGSFGGGGVGFLNIDGGTVEILTYLAEGLSGFNVSSAITLTNNGVLNLQPSNSTAPATASFDTLNFSSGTVTNGTLAFTNLNFFSPATSFPVYSATVLNPGLVSATGSLTVNGGLDLNGGTLGLDVASTSSLDSFNVTGALNLSGTSFVSLNPLNSLVAGSYPMMTYGSLSGSGSLQVAGPVAESRYNVSFDTTSPTVTMNISGAPANLSWSGGNNANTWDLKITTNWNAGGDLFYTYDTVDFGDAGSASPAVNLNGTLLPLGVSVSGSQNYTFSGTGKISGKSGLTVNTSSQLTILTTNDYVGGTIINSGTLVLGDGSSAQGTLGSGAITNNGTLVFNPADSQTNAIAISGSGTVIKRGPGLMRLSAANTFTGPVTIEAGTLQAGNAAALGNATVSGGAATVQSGATLDIAGSALGTKSIIATGAGVNNAGAVFNSGGSQFMRDVQLGGDTTIGGTAGITISSSSASSTDPGLTAYDYKLTKAGANHLKIECLRATPWNLQLGDVDIQDGAMSFYGNLNLGSQSAKPITVHSNAVVAFAHNAAFPLTKAISLDAGSCIYGLGTASAIDGSITLNGKGTLDIANAMSLTVNSPIGGSGPLVKGVGVHPSMTASTGTGNLILSAANTFTGDLRIETGKVILTNNATVDQAANVILAGGSLDVSGRTDATLTLAGSQSLKGNGSIIGTVNSSSTTTVAPGENSIGVLSVTGSVILGGTTIVELTKNGNTLTNDKLNVTATLTLGGTLNITFSGAALAPGDKFTLFNAGTRLGQFDSVNLPVIAGVVWTNKTTIDGSIEVLSIAPQAPPTIIGGQMGPGGNFNLQFSGTDGSSYSVRSSTNVATPVSQWTVLSSGVFGPNATNFQDFNTTNYLQRFYLITTP